MAERRLRAVGRRAQAAADSTSPEEAKPSHDGELMTRIRRGDEAAFAEFYDRHSGVVFGLVLRVVRNRAIAEEVAQETFVDAWQQAARFDPTRGSERAWVTTIAHRRAVDRIRSEEASTRRDESDARRSTTRPAEPEDVVIESLDDARVRAALDNLSKLQRQSIELAYFGGNTYGQVAALLDVPLGTVKTRIRDGLIRLRDSLEVTP